MKSVLVSIFEFAAAFAVGLVCAAAMAFGAPDDGFAEFPEETEALVAAPAAFFDEVEQASPRTGERAPVIRIPDLARKIKGATPDAGAGELTRNGPVRHLTGYRINWYPVDRFLGSVDFMGTWNGNRNLVCGYLTWDLSRPEAPVLNAVTANFIDLDDFDGKSPSEIHEFLLEANCAYGAIDDNYAFFEPGSS